MLNTELLYLVTVTIVLNYLPFHQKTIKTKYFPTNGLKDEKNY